MENRKTVQIEYCLKEYFKIPFSEMNGRLRRYYVSKDNTHFILTDQGKVYHGQSSQGVLDVEPFVSDLPEDIDVRHISSFDENEIFFIDKFNRVYCLNKNRVIKSGYVVAESIISDFHVAKRDGANRDIYFFFVAKIPSYYWCREIDLFDVEEQDQFEPVNKYFHKRQLFGQLGNSMLVHSSHCDNLILLLTSNRSRSKSFAVVTDIFSEKVIHCIDIPGNFELIRGVLFDSNSFVFLTKNNELLCLYHLQHTIKFFLDACKGELVRATGGKWDEFRKKNRLPKEPSIRNTFRYAKALKYFIEENNLSREYGSLLKHFDSVLNSSQCYGSNYKSLAEVHPDFRNTRAYDMYYFEGHLYIIAMNGFIYKFSISLKNLID